MVVMSPSLDPSADDFLAQVDHAHATLKAAAGDAGQHPIWGSDDVLVGQWRHELSGQDSDALIMGIRIRRIAMVIDRLIIEQCEPRGIKHHEFILMMALRRKGDPYTLRPSDLLWMYSVTSGTATYRVDKLVQRDLVARELDPKDRRAFLIRLTPHGKEVVDAILGHLRGLFGEQLKPFAEIAGGFQALESGLRLFEACLLSESQP